MSERLKIRVSEWIKVLQGRKIPSGFFFTVETQAGEILYEYYNGSRNWGIQTCANWIRQYNKEQEDVNKIETEQEETETTENDQEETETTDKIENDQEEELNAED